MKPLKGHWILVTVFVTILLLVGAMPTSALAGQKETSTPPTERTPVGRTVVSLHLPEPTALDMAMPENYRKQDHYIYNKYFAPKDDSLLAEYSTQWRLHEIQSQYGLNDSRNFEFSGIGQLTRQSEEEMRENLARRAFRTRINSSLMLAFGEGNAGRSYEKIKSGLSALGDIKLTGSKKPQPQKNPNSNNGAEGSGNQNPAPLESSENSPSLVPELKLGYDVFADSSKFECLMGGVTAGVYHAATLDSLSDGEPMVNRARLNLSADIGRDLPTPSVGYSLRGDSMDGALSKSLSQDVSASISTTQPLQEGAIESYNMGISYRF